MAEDNTKYGKYFISEPKIETNLSGHNESVITRGMTPAQVYLDSKIMPESPFWFDFVWIYDDVVPKPWVFAHKHDVAEILVFMATNAEHDLGGIVTLGMGEGKDQEIHTITKSTVVFIPPGVVHCPLTHVSVDPQKPQMFFACLLRSDYTSDEAARLNALKG